MKQNSSYYGYDYFCGANIYVKINGAPAVEIAGISYQVQESTAPIYGYSSRIFDAVAMGQKIVRGNLVINFIHPNYLAQIIERGHAAGGIKYVVDNKHQAQTISVGDKVALAEKYLAAEEDFMKSLQEPNGLGSGMWQIYQSTDIQKRLQALDDTAFNPESRVYTPSKEEYVTQRMNEAGTDNRGGIFAENDSQRYIAMLEREWKMDWENKWRSNDQKRRLIQKELDGDEFKPSSDEFKKDMKIFLADLKTHARVPSAEELKMVEEGEYGMQDILNNRSSYFGARDSFFQERFGSDYNYAEEEKVLAAYKKQKKKYESMLRASEGEEKKHIQAQAALDKEIKRLSSDFPGERNDAFASLDAMDKAYNDFYATSQTQRLSGGVETYTTDIGLLGPFIIDIQYAKEYTIKIIDAFFTSRGSMIQIDESSIVEEYSFFAREIKYITN